MRTHRTSRLLASKIRPIGALLRIVAGLKKQRKKIVFTNGCFDILHFGHVKYLQEAKHLGDILIVGINSDASIRKLKGNARPIINEKDRCQTLAGLESVDYVVVFGEVTPLRLIAALKPDVLVKGADWDKHNIVGSDIVLRHGGKVKTIRLMKGRSTTDLIKRIAQKIRT